MTILGAGLITATALVTFVGEVLLFPTGRHFTSLLGVTPWLNIWAWIKVCRCQRDC
jgi:hypothetical protein